MEVKVPVKNLREAAIEAYETKRQKALDVNKKFLREKLIKVLGMEYADKAVYLMDCNEAEIDGIRFRAGQRGLVLLPENPLSIAQNEIMSLEDLGKRI